MAQTACHDKIQMHFPNKPMLSIIQIRHERDVNAAINIENEGICILLDEEVNLWDRGDSMLILLLGVSTDP